MDTGCADSSMRKSRRGEVISVCGDKVTEAFDVAAVVEDAVASC